MHFFCLLSSMTINVVVGERWQCKRKSGKDNRERKREEKKDAHFNRFPTAGSGRVVSKGYGHSMMNLVYRRTGLSVLNRNKDDGPGGTSACWWWWWWWWDRGLPMPADVPADPMQSRPAAAATSFSAANLRKQNRNGVRVKTPESFWKIIIKLREGRGETLKHDTCARFLNSTPSVFSGSVTDRHGLSIPITDSANSRYFEFSKFTSFKTRRQKIRTSV